MRIAKARGRETFVPLAHPPGHAQVDFGEAVGVIGGMRCKIHFFCMTCPSRMPVSTRGIRPRRRKRFWTDMSRPFAFFGGVPLSVLYDNLKIAIAKINHDGRRERTRAFTELVSITCLPTGSGVLARETTRARSRDL